MPRIVSYAHGGAAGGIRTLDPLDGNQMLYSELQPHVATGTLKGVLLAHSISIPNFWASLQRKFLLIT